MEFGCGLLDLNQYRFSVVTSFRSGRCCWLGLSGVVGSGVSGDVLGTGFSVYFRPENNILTLAPLNSDHQKNMGLTPQRLLELIDIVARHQGWLSKGKSAFS